MHPNMDDNAGWAIDPSLFANSTSQTADAPSSASFLGEQASQGPSQAAPSGAYAPAGSSMGTSQRVSLSIATNNLGAPADPYGLGTPSQYSMYLQQGMGAIPGSYPGGAAQAGQRRPAQLNTGGMHAYPPQLGGSPYPLSPLHAQNPFHGFMGLPYFTQPQNFSPVGYGPTSAPLTPAQQIDQLRGYLNYLEAATGKKGDATTPTASAGESGQRPALIGTLTNKRKRGEKAPSSEPGWALRVYGSANLPRLPAWGPVVNGRHIFSYNEFGELQAHKTYSACEIAEFIDTNSRPVELWVQQSPPQMKERLGPNRNKCCWARCPSKDRVIEMGWLRVGFYEFPEEVKSGDRDPLQPATQMHLWCFERCLDPVVYRRNGKLAPDYGAGRYPKEQPNKTAIDKASDKNIIEQAYEPWFEGKVPQAQRRPYEETLSHALNRHHLDCQPTRRGVVRNDHNVKKAEKNRKTIDYHVGNLPFFLNRALPTKRSQYAFAEVYDADNEFQAAAGSHQLATSDVVSSYPVVPAATPVNPLRTSQLELPVPSGARGSVDRPVSSGAAQPLELPAPSGVADELELPVSSDAVDPELLAQLEGIPMSNLAEEYEPFGDIEFDISNIDTDNLELFDYPGPSPAVEKSPSPKRRRPSAS
jgi:hypothetical protein